MCTYVCVYVGVFVCLCVFLCVSECLYALFPVSDKVICQNSIFILMPKMVYPMFHVSFTDDVTVDLMTRGVIGGNVQI